MQHVTVLDWLGAVAWEYWRSLDMGLSLHLQQGWMVLFFFCALIMALLLVIFGRIIDWAVSRDYAVVGGSVVSLCCIGGVVV